MKKTPPKIQQPKIVEHPDGTLESITPWEPLSPGDTVGAQMHIRVQHDRMTLDIRFSEWSPRLHALAFASPDQLAARLPLPVPLAARLLTLLIIQAAQERERLEQNAS